MRYRSIVKKTSREKAEAVAEENFLNCKTNKRVCRIFRECPDISQKIEELRKEVLELMHGTAQVCSHSMATSK
jgi:hypothetical protein